MEASTFNLPSHTDPVKATEIVADSIPTRNVGTRTPISTLPMLRVGTRTLRSAETFAHQNA